MFSFGGSKANESQKCWLPFLGFLALNLIHVSPALDIDTFFPFVFFSFFGTFDIFGMHMPLRPLSTSLRRVDMFIIVIIYV